MKNTLKYNSNLLFTKKEEDIYIKPKFSNLNEKHSKI
jgi:hypothetical protein